MPQKRTRKIFVNPDGHHWELVWMDTKAVPRHV